MSDGFDPQVLIAPVLRSLAASSADAAQRGHEAAAEAAEMSAWDAYALAAVRFGTDNDVTAEHLSTVAADFADKMIDRRRKYFGASLGGIIERHGLEVPKNTHAKPET